MCVPKISILIKDYQRKQRTAIIIWLPHYRYTKQEVVMWYAGLNADETRKLTVREGPAGGMSL